MSDKHEEHCAEVFGGRKHKASGSQWDEQADGSNAHDLEFAFRWDGKATLAKSHTITLDMLAKLKDQSHGERPALPLCWYASTSLDFGELWTLVQDDDLTELLEIARETEQLRERNRELEEGLQAALRDVEQMGTQASMASGEIQALQEQVDALRRQVGTSPAGGAGGGGSVGASGSAGSSNTASLGGGGTVSSAYARHAARPPVPEYVPMLPWVVINQFDVGSHRHTDVTRYAIDGARTSGTADTVVVERSLGAANRPRLIVDGIRVPNGSLYASGRLKTLACESRPDIEVG
jgi:hypothetical protein